MACKAQVSPQILTHSLCIQVSFESVFGKARPGNDKALNNVPLHSSDDCLQKPWAQVNHWVNYQLSVRNQHDCSICLAGQSCKHCRPSH